MKKQEYKNSIVTKKKIASAYLSLLIENPNNINVTEIVKKAGIYRGTFYIHFENVKMVEQFIEKELAENFLDLETDFRLVQIDKTPEIIIDKLNEILKRDLVFYRLFITAACNTNLMETIKKSILVSISNNFQVIQYITGGVIGTYTDWFKGNIQCTLDELKTHLSALIKTGLKEFIQDAN